MKRILVCFAVAAALAAAGCSGGDGDGGIPADANLVVLLTDAPMDGMRSVNVTIDAVSVHQSASAGSGDAGWTEMPVTAPMPADLLRLRGGVLMELCGARLAAGHYQQVRLQIRQNQGGSGRNWVVDARGERHALDMPSEIKLVHQFSVAEGTRTDLRLDFRAEESVRMRGNGEYFCQPVIHASTTVR